MGDACCAHDDAPVSAEAPAPVWMIREIQAAAAAGVLLVAGLVTGAGDADPTSAALLVAALVVGGSTFVPETLRALREGSVPPVTHMARRGSTSSRGWAVRVWTWTRRGPASVVATIQGPLVLAVTARMGASSTCWKGRPSESRTTINSGRPLRKVHR